MYSSQISTRATDALSRLTARFRQRVASQPPYPDARSEALETIAALRAAVDRVRQLDRLCDAVVEMDDTTQTAAECYIEQEAVVPCAELGDHSATSSDEDAPPIAQQDGGYSFDPDGQAWIDVGTFMEMAQQSRAARAVVTSTAALVLCGVAMTLTTPYGPVQHLRAARSREPGYTFATALAVDQRTGYVFVATGTFSSRTAGATAAGKLTVLQTRQGLLRPIRTVPVGYGPSTVLIDERAGRVLVLNTGGGDQYAGFTGGSVSVLDLRALEGSGPASRAVVHNTYLGRQLPREMAIDRISGHAFVANWTLPPSGVFTQTAPGSVSVLDTRTGVLLHTRSRDAVAERVAVDEAAGRAIVLGGPIPSQVARSEASVVDTRSGAIVQTFTTARCNGPIAVDARTHHLFVPTVAGVQMWATRGGGTLVRTLTVSQTVALAVDAGRGRLFAQSVESLAGGYWSSGRVSMLDVRSGAPLATARVGVPDPSLQVFIGGTPQTLLVDTANGQILAAGSAVTGSKGTAGSRNAVSVLAVRGRTLHVVRTIALSASPVAIAADASAGHAFVVTRSMTGRGLERPGLSMLDLRTGTLVAHISL